MTSLKKYSTRLHTAEAAMLLALGISLCLAVWGGAQSSQLSQKLVRLHVVAASDEQYEQELKLRVRDAVLDFAEPLLSDASSAGEARETLLENLDGIKAAAESAAEGRPVSVTLREENYPTRRYEDFSLPAGRYSSLVRRVPAAVHFRRYRASRRTYRRRHARDRARRQRLRPALPRHGALGRTEGPV